MPVILAPVSCGEAKENYKIMKECVDEEGDVAHCWDGTYNCVEEVNPILGKSPTVNDIIGLKVILLAPALWHTNKKVTITDEDLAGANYMMTAVVANNFGVWADAKDNCNKIR